MLSLELESQRETVKNKSPWGFMIRIKQYHPKASQVRQMGL